MASRAPLPALVERLRVGRVVGMGVATAEAVGVLVVLVAPGVAR